MERGEERITTLKPQALAASRLNLLKEAMYLNRLGMEQTPKTMPVVQRRAYAEHYVFSHLKIALDEGELLAGKIGLPSPEEEARFDSLLSQPDPDGVPGQRGHAVLDNEKLLRLGVEGIQEEIHQYLQGLAPGDKADEQRRNFYQAALISLDGFLTLARRYREKALALADQTADPRVKQEMTRLAGILAWVPAKPARTFYEALQSIHLLYFAGILTECALFGPGRIDQILFPYYQRDLAQGILTPPEALELLCCQYLLMNQVFGSLPQPVMLGGQNEDGHDMTNALTYLCLDALEKTGLVNPSVAISCHPHTPPDLYQKSARLLLKGYARPALFNDTVIIPGLMDLGVPKAEAVNYVHSTCVEITPIASSNVWVASPYFNLLKPIEYLLNEGDSLSGCQESPKWSFTPWPLAQFRTFADVWAQYKNYLADMVQQGLEEQNHYRRERMERWATPFTSCFTRDCLAKGKDKQQGGARYNWIETSHVGLANAVDSLAAIKKLVFTEHRYTLEQLKGILLENFPDEGQRLEIASCIEPYGNDHEATDALARELVDFIYSLYDEAVAIPHSRFVPGFFCWIMHGQLGKDTAASLDGRRAGEALADGAGAGQGKDRCGPTALIKSVTQWDHRRAIGGLALNLRFVANAFRDPEAVAKLISLVQTYFELGGFEVQINAVDGEILRDAQAHPANYRDLLVRVAGYSEYFTLLDKTIQDEIIKRTEYAL